MKYPDTVKLATTTPDGYGDRTVTLLADIPAAFIKRAGMVHTDSIEGETSDAAVYLLPSNATVLDLAEKDELEGKYIQYKTQWYRISAANVAERKLLNNAIDNVYCRLDKVAGIAYAQS
jgi:hypothetical protein